MAPTRHVAWRVTNTLVTTTLAALAIVSVVLAVLGPGWGGRRWWTAPAPVPDHAAPFAATSHMTFAGQRSLAQRIKPQQNRLIAVDLLISAEAADLPGDVVLRLEDWPARRLLRTASRPAAMAPAGSAWTIRPGQPRGPGQMERPGQPAQLGERWLTFGFEPVEDSAGHDYLLVVSYPDGADVPGQRLATLAHFPKSYSPGELLVNDDPVNGTLLFRLASLGTRADALQAAGRNLARVQPVAAGTLIFPGALAFVCGTLAMALVAVFFKPAGGAAAPGLLARSGSGALSKSFQAVERPAVERPAVEPLEGEASERAK